MASESEVLLILYTITFHFFITLFMQEAKSTHFHRGMSKMEENIRPFGMPIVYLFSKCYNETVTGT